MTLAGALFSDDRRYRYRLWRRWGKGQSCCFVMLNPSTADEIDNDPTVERCERRARSWGWGGLEVVNIFALRSTDPKVLYRNVYGNPANAVGPHNDAAIHGAVERAGVVVCAWGAHGKLLDRGDQVLSLLRRLGVAPHALRITKGGQPAHPLYLPYSLMPEPMP